MATLCWYAYNSKHDWQASSESGSSENGEGVGKVGGGMESSVPVGGVLGEVQDADLLGNGDRRDGRKRHVFV